MSEWESWRQEGILLPSTDTELVETVPYRIGTARPDRPRAYAQPAS